MATIPKQKVSLTEAAPVFNAATTGDKVDVNRDTIVIFRNASGGSIAVTAVGVNACDQGVLHNETITCPNSADTMVGGFGSNRFKDANGQVQFTWTGTLTVAVIES